MKLLLAAALSSLLLSVSSAVSVDLSQSPHSIAYLRAISSYMSSMRLMKPDSREGLNEYFNTVDANGDN